MSEELQRLKACLYLHSFVPKGDSVFFKQQ